MSIRSRIREHPLTRWALEQAFTGKNVWCPVCDSWFRRFGDFNGANRLCWHCGSFERDRIIALYLRDNPSLLRPGARVLHVAPEPPTSAVLRRIPGVEYISGDLLGQFGGARIDVTDLSPYEDDHFDIIVCNHVLEHVPDDAAAMRELRRVLAPGGWGIMLVPDLGQLEVTIEEDIGNPRDAEYRTEHFGQGDHVRKYGWDYVDRLKAAGLQVKVEDPERLWPRSTLYRARLRKFDEVEPLIVVG